MTNHRIVIDDKSWRTFGGDRPGLRWTARMYDPLGDELCAPGRGSSPHMAVINLLNNQLTDAPRFTIKSVVLHVAAMPWQSSVPRRVWQVRRQGQPIGIEREFDTFTEAIAYVSTQTSRSLTPGYLDQNPGRVHSGRNLKP